MAWIVRVLEIADSDGKPTGRWRLTAKSDEGGGGPFGDTSHDHPSADEAEECIPCKVYCGRVTGFPYRPECAHGWPLDAEPACPKCKDTTISSLRSQVAALTEALGKAEEALKSCIYECNSDAFYNAKETWCPSCGEILRAVNMKGEDRAYSHADGCKLEAALAAIPEVLNGQV